MRIKLPYGSTAENNQLTLQVGELSVDLERKAIRFHDGVTQGGFEVVGEQAYVPPPPFQGEIPTSALITGTSLASLLGLTAGTAQHSTEPWLHFIDPVDGKHKYIAKKPYRHSLSWVQLQAVNTVYGNRTVSIGGQTYRVRLLKGCNADPTPAAAGFNPPGTEHSEWNRLLYSVHNGVHTHTGDTTPPGITPLYSDADLLLHGSFGNGAYCWCQETQVSNASARVSRGSSGVSYLGFSTSSTTNSRGGWRPCLELIA